MTEPPRKRSQRFGTLISRSSSAIAGRPGGIGVSEPPLVVGGRRTSVGRSPEPAGLGVTSGSERCTRVAGSVGGVGGAGDGRRGRDGLLRLIGGGRGCNRQLLRGGLLRSAHVRRHLVAPRVRLLAGHRIVVGDTGLVRCSALAGDVLLAGRSVIVGDAVLVCR